MLDRLEEFNRTLSTCLEWVGLLGILVMMFITCIDVIGAKLFLYPVFGAIDFVILAQLVAISFAAGSALILGRHIQVEFFMIMLPKRLQAAVDAIVHFLGFVLFGLIIWRLILYGYSLQIGGEVSSTARIPLYFFAYGVALASVPVCLVLLLKLIKSTIKVANR